MAEKIHNLPQNLIKLVDFKDFGIENMLDNGEVTYIILDSVGVLIMNTFKHLVSFEQFALGGQHSGSISRSNMIFQQIKVETSVIPLFH